MAANKVSAAEYEKRVRTIQHMILNESHPYDLTNAVMTEYGISKRQAQNYIQRARTEIAEAGKRMLEEEVSKSVMFHGRLISWAMQESDKLEKRAAKAEAKEDINSADSLRRRQLPYRQFASTERDKIDRIIGIGQTTHVIVPPGDTNNWGNFVVGSKVITNPEDVGKEEAK